MTRYRFLTIILLILLVSAKVALAWDYGWTHHEEGLSTGRFDLGDMYNSRDSTLFVVRIDPAKWEFKAFSAAELMMANNLSVRQWAKQHDLVAVINAGMYDVDRKTHIGYFHSKNSKNNKLFHSRYKSVFAFHPKGKQPLAQLFDLDVTSFDTIKKHYHSVVQNERLIKKPGENRWNPGGKTWWSEAALAEDSKGRILFLYTPASFKMYDFNNLLLELPLDIVAAQHLEGGFPAQIYFNFDGYEVEFHSGYEVDFSKDKKSVSGIQIPNVIGIMRR